MLSLALIISYGLLRAKSQVTCTANEHCEIDCSSYGDYTCQRGVIDASDADSLRLDCNDETYNCQDTVVRVPEASDAYVTVLCSKYRSCDGLQINGSTALASTQQITLICSADNACQNVDVYGNETGGITMDCGWDTGGAECEYVNLFASNAENVELFCAASSAGGCSEVNVYAQDAGSVHLNCLNAFGCYLDNIYAIRADYLTVSAIGKDTIQSCTIHGEEIGTSYTVTASGNGTNNAAMDYVDLYIPETDISKFTLNCYGTGCGNFNMYRVSGFSDIADATININACLQIDDDPAFYELVDLMTVYCNDFSTSSGNGYAQFPYSNSEWVCDPRWGSGTACDCEAVAAVFSNYYNDATDANCLLPPGTVVCEDGAACDIDCGSDTCQNIVIDGTRASSLIVSCPSSDTCSGTRIYAATSSGATSEVTCGSLDNDYTTGWGACDGNDGFSTEAKDFIVFGDDAYDLTVKAYPGGLAGDNGRKVYAREVQSSFDLACIGNFTSRFYGSENRYACWGNYVYITETDADLSRYTLGCYGTGCGDLRLIKANGYENIGQANLRLNGCGQCEVGSGYTESEAIFNCFRYLYMGCDECTFSASDTCDYFPNTASNLGCLDSSGTETCDCETAASAWTSTYSNDLEDENCILLAGATPAPVTPSPVETGVTPSPVDTNTPPPVDPAMSGNKRVNGIIGLIFAMLAVILI